ncbi:DGQHR domain-containing protein [Pedobacter deserti]|uniref:DGQHR domain-containing protein n=1 Tax=Pedobacter deserti TaxID=2817382 RepID=UPI00210A96D6|nr:DGQHR domain-containing protein [Pedobacter sp. SYSU D00382]
MDNQIKARKVIQNNQEFLLGVFRYSQFKNFTKYTERLITGYAEVDDEDRAFEELSQVSPVYNPQIQRKTNSAKIERIADFLITDPTAMFPTNIVLAIPKQVIDNQVLDQEGNMVLTLNRIVKEELEKSEGIVFLTIVDGQHRIKGLERAIERLQKALADPRQETDKVRNQAILNRLMNLELVVTFFIDPILEYQAMIFSIINKTQTKVPENLVFSLFGLTLEDTPQKTALEVILALNGLEKSPFFKRVKLVGGNYQRGVDIPLSQATMVKSVLYNICHNQREAEIERNKKRGALSNNPYNLPFRPYYAQDNDRMIIRIMYTFFKAVRDSFIGPGPVFYWDIGSTQEVNVLQTNVGYQALMKVLKYLLPVIPEADRDKKEIYMRYLSAVKNINWLDNGQEKRYPFTSKSINILYDDIRRELEIP